MTAHGRFGRFFPAMASGRRSRNAHDGEMFKDAGLHFLQSRMILVQHDFRFIQIQPSSASFFQGRPEANLCRSGTVASALGVAWPPCGRALRGFFSLVGQAPAVICSRIFWFHFSSVAQLLLDDPHFLVQHVLFVVLVQPCPGFFVHQVYLESRRINLQQLLHRIQPGSISRLPGWVASLPPPGSAQPRCRWLAQGQFGI